LGREKRKQANKNKSETKTAELIGNFQMLLMPLPLLLTQHFPS
jgi:hypothetical protein